MRWTLLTCRVCRHAIRCTPVEVLRRLQTTGVLRREKDPPWDLVCELLPGGADQMVCEACEEVGLDVQHDLDIDDWGEVVRSCEKCGQRIPAERLELFPEMRRCASCHSLAADEELDEDDFCPRCGAKLIVRTRSSGVTRYVSYCPDCRK